jgi:hypothetical protein
MRLAESKVIVDTLSEACGKAEQTGIIDVKALVVGVHPLNLEC